MKNLHQFLAVVVFLAIGSVASAQDVFSVLATKGNVQVQRKGQGEWGKLFTGSKLGKTDVVKVDDGAYLGLVHLKSGKAKELRSGSVSLTNLDKEMSSVSGVGSKVVAYVSQDVTGSANRFQDYRKSMSNLGSIERDIKGVLSPELPRKTKVMDSMVAFNWQIMKKDASLNNGFVFEISNRMGTPVYTRETKDTFVVMNVDKLNLKHGEHYYWRVSVKDQVANDDDSQPFTILDNHLRKGIEADLKSFQAEENTPLNKIMLARYFEDKELIIDAMKAYQGAITMAPDVIEYRELYAMFLDRHEMAFLANKVRREAVASLNK